MILYSTLFLTFVYNCVLFVLLFYLVVVVLFCVCRFKVKLVPGANKRGKGHYKSDTLFMAYICILLVCKNIILCNELVYYEKQEVELCTAIS